MRDHSDTLHLGTRKGLLTLQRGAEGWRVARHSHVGTPVAYAATDPRTGTLWACLDHGHWGQKLERSRDGGETWEKVASPAYPEDARMMMGFPGSESHKEVPATLRYLWCFTAGGADQPGRIYFGTEPGGLFRSDDDGDTFHLVKGLWDHPSRLTGWFGGGRDTPGIHSICVDPHDSTHLYVGISCAGVFESKDDGATWQVRNKGLQADFLPDPGTEIGHDPHFLTLCEDAPQVMWQQNHCGIFRSQDGGQSWSKISQAGGPAHFGFPIAADPRNPSVAWVVPAQSDEHRLSVNGALCVCRTNDGGETWPALRNGLPQESSYDIVFRHALDQAGDRVAFGSTTGNVYLSDDRGENWQSLGHHFPPIYSARFA
ncbi:MAG: WD40/YVTN/BNR-like repeat-containing protein [Actinomycetota bacterium]